MYRFFTLKLHNSQVNFNDCFGTNERTSIMASSIAKRLSSCFDTIITMWMFKNMTTTTSAMDGDDDDVTIC